MKKCDKSTSSQQEQFEIWMDSIEAISDLIIEAREEIDNDRCLPKKVLIVLKQKYFILGFKKSLKKYIQFYEFFQKVNIIAICVSNV